jgi:hypothetical protein
MVAFLPMEGADSEFAARRHAATRCSGGWPLWCGEPRAAEANPAELRQSLEPSRSFVSR